MSHFAMFGSYQIFSIFYYFMKFYLLIYCLIKLMKYQQINFGN